MVLATLRRSLQDWSHHQLVYGLGGEVLRIGRVKWWRWWGESWWSWRGKHGVTGGDRMVVLLHEVLQLRPGQTEHRAQTALLEWNSWIGILTFKISRLVSLYLFHVNFLWWIIRCKNESSGVGTFQHVDGSGGPLLSWTCGGLLACFGFL